MPEFVGTRSIAGIKYKVRQAETIEELAADDLSEAAEQMRCHGFVESLVLDNPLGHTLYAFRDTEGHYMFVDPAQFIGDEEKGCDR